MLGLLFELFNLLAWIGFMIFAMFALLALRLTAWVLMPILRAIARSFRSISIKNHAFRGEGNDTP